MAAAAALESAWSISLPVSAIRLSRMSTIDPRLNPQLTAGLDALERQRADGLQGRGDGLVEGIGEDLREQAPRGPAIDAGEAVLTAPAWEGDASRLLQAAELPAGFPGGDLAQDANVAADSVAAALGLG
jgi:hypothetical protein